MQKLSGIDIRIILFLLALVAVSLACKAHDALDFIQEADDEKCYTIDREEYESYADQLGQMPETPKYPESAVYEVCFFDHDELSRVRMSEGYRSEEENKIPVGTYTGETNFYTTLDNDVDNSYLEPVCNENTVNVVIASDGTAQGEIRSICYSKQDTDNEEMQMTHHSDVTGMIQGELQDMSGQLSITYTWHTYITSPQWETPSLDKTIDFDFLYNVNISNNVMTFTPAGDVEDYYSFTLRKE